MTLLATAFDAACPNNGATADFRWRQFEFKFYTHGTSKPQYRRVQLNFSHNISKPPTIEVEGFGPTFECAAEKALHLMVEKSKEISTELLDQVMER